VRVCVCACVCETERFVCTMLRGKVDRSQTDDIDDPLKTSPAHEVSVKS